MAAQGREGVSRGASASATLSGIRSRSFAARASAPASRRSFPLALAALAMAVAVALTILAVDLALRANGVERSDARLVEALRASAGALSLKVRTAEAEAETLAESQAVQLALANHDQSRLNDLVGQARVPVLVQGTQGSEAGRTVADAIRRSATIGPPGSRLGQVTAFVPLDGRLLDSIERTSDAHAGIAIALARGGTLVVAPGLLQDARLAVRDGSPADATIAGAQYRTAAMTVVGGRPPTQLVALVPQPLVDSGSDRRRRVIVAVVATAATAGLLLLTLQLVRGRRRTRTGSRDRRRSLGPRSMSIGREGGRDALALVGDALAATHDPEALLPVILGAAIEATGATGGRLVAGSRELAVRGTSANDGGSLVVPLGNGDDTGSLVLFPPATGFSLEARELARWLAAQASIALENARLHGLVKAQAVTDELTGLSNRRRFMEVLELELKRSDRFESPLALVLADLDDFKLVNDRFGHQTGDDVLRALSGVLRASLRADVDLPARLGGEEFAVLLPETDALGAQGLAERLREELAALELQGPGEQLLSVTASFGVAVYPDAASGDELLTLADAALYAAKAAGKNRVVIAPNGA